MFVMFCRFHCPTFSMQHHSCLASTRLPDYIPKVYKYSLLCTQVQLSITSRKVVLFSDSPVTLYFRIPTLPFVKTADQQSFLDSEGLTSNQSNRSQRNKQTERDKRCNISLDLSLYCPIPTSRQYILAYLILEHAHSAHLGVYFCLAARPTTFLSVPNGKTSPILFLPVNNMTNRSMPMPQPPVGGRPHSRASR